MKLHLGCGNKFLEGYKHIDFSNFEHIDWKSPIYPLPFIKSNSVKEIYSSHALEYFDYSDCQKVITDWKILRTSSFGSLGGFVNKSGFGFT